MRTKLGYLLPAITSTGLIALLVFSPMFFFVLVLAGLMIGISVFLFGGSKTTVYQPTKSMVRDIDDALEDDIRHHDYGYGGFGTGQDEKHD